MMIRWFVSISKVYALGLFFADYSVVYEDKPSLPFSFFHVFFVSKGII